MGGCVARRVGCVGGVGWVSERYIYGWMWPFAEYGLKNTLHRIRSLRIYSPQIYTDNPQMKSDKKIKFNNAFNQ